MSLLIQERSLVLFQGDSITDASRDRNNEFDLGRGYAFMAAAWLGSLYPEKNLRFLNRGISGDRVNNLQDRWEKECIHLEPDWLSILIGVNDTWATSTQEFSDRYYALLERTVAECSQARLIICEPFFLPLASEGPGWRERLDPKITVVCQLARDFKALFVPFDGLFAQAATRREASYWTSDGVHPSDAGHALMAQAWLSTVGAL